MYTVHETDSPHYIVKPETENNTSLSQ